MNIARTGFRHVRVCNDCEAIIDSNGSCKCNIFHGFNKGTKVVVCSDKECNHIIQVAEIGVIGNGAVRLAKTDQWYNFDGSAQKNTRAEDYIRVCKDEDIEFINKRNKTEEAKKLFVFKISKLKGEITDLKYKFDYL